jgi:hypothetical protein
MTDDRNKRLILLEGDHNYQEWADEAMIRLSLKGLSKTIRREKTEKDVDWEDECERAYQELLYIMKARVRLALRSQDDMNPRALWERAREMYAIRDNNAKLVASQSILNAKPSQYKNINEYIGFIRQQQDILAYLGEKINQMFLASIVINSLPEEYKQLWMQVLGQADIMDHSFTFEEVAKILVHEHNRKKVLSGKDNTNEDSSKALRVGNFGRQDKKGGSKGSSRVECKNCKRAHKTEKCWHNHPDQAPDWWNKNKDDKGSKDEEREKDKKDRAYRATQTSQNNKEWFLDSGAEIHVTGDSSVFSTYTPRESEVYGFDGITTKAVGVGSVVFHTNEGQVTLYNVHYVPKSHCNLISTTVLASKGCKVIMGRDSHNVLDEDDKLLFEGRKMGKSFIVYTRLYTPKHQVFIARPRAKAASWDDWHRRLGHPGIETVKLTARMTTGIDIDGADALQSQQPARDICEACVMGKQQKFRNHEPKRNQDASLPGERWYMDTAGGGHITPTLGGAKYVLAVTDEATDMMSFYLLPTRDAKPISDSIKDVILKTKAKGYQTAYIRSDNAKEFGQGPVARTLEDLGITWEPTMPHSPHQNGVAEVQFRTLFERIRAVLFDSDLPEEFWGEALNFIIYIRARLTSKALHLKKTPYEAWTGKQPDLSHIRPFGCICWAYDHEAYKQKLKFRGIKCRLLGFGQGGNQYRLWSIEKQSILNSSYVVFDEKASMKGANNATEQASSPDIPDDDNTAYEWDNVWEEGPPSGHRAEIVGNTYNYARSTDQAAAQTDGQEADIHTMGENEDILHTSSDGDIAPAQTTNHREAPSSTANDENIGAAPIQSDGNETPPQTTVDEGIAEPSSSQSERSDPPIRRTTRPHMTTNYHELHHHGRNKAFIVQASKLDIPAGEAIPKDAKEALSGPNKDKWTQAFKRELNSIKEKDVWTVQTPPKGRKVLPGRWVLSTKLNPNGSIARYKARWVAKGFEQIEGIDYNVTFSSVVKTSSWKTLLALGTKNNMEIEHSDVETAYLESPITEEVWVEQPHGFEQGTGACRLKKALYGLKQSAREWYETLKRKLTQMGYEVLQKDRSIFRHHKNSSIIATYVDDLLIMTTNKHEMDIIKKQLDQRFKLKHLGPLSYYLGMEVKRDREARTMTVSQKGYISQLLKQLDMQDCYTVKSPMDVNTRFEKPRDDYEAPKELKQAFESIMGALNWIAGMTRPDISYAAHRLSRHLAKPTKDHIQAATRVIRYLAKTTDIGIHYGPHETHNGTLRGYSDSSWHDDADNGRSTAAYVYKLWNGPISWRSKQEPLVALSSTEAEYIAASEASKEALYLQELLQELKYNHGDVDTVRLLVDNESAISLANNPVNHPKTKHIRLRYHKIRELVEDKSIGIEWVPTRSMAADPLTKPMPAANLEHTLRLLGLKSEQKSET